MKHAGPFVWLGLAIGVSYCLLRKPLTLYDGIDPIIAAIDAESLTSLFWNAFYNTAYFRPLRLTQIKVLYDMSAGYLFEVYAGFHVVLTVAAAALLAALTAPASWAGLAGASLAAVIFFGLHTTPVLFLEAYPINHFLEIIVFMLLGIYAAARMRGAAAGIVAVLTTAAALLTLESGVLVWLAVVTAWVLGWRGLSRIWLAAVGGVLAAYVGVRTLLLEMSTPSLSERSTGFGFGSLDPPELVARFADNPLPLYLYNIISSWTSVLLAEPRGGTWHFVRQLTLGDVKPFFYINVVTSLVTSALIVYVTVEACRALFRGTLTDRLRLVLLFWIILAANGVLSYAYTKDVIMSPAGAMYALAAFAAVTTLLERRPIPSTALVIVCVLLSVGWTSRTAGLFYGLRYQAYRQANDWAFMKDIRMDELSPAARPVVERLRRTMVTMEVPTPTFVRSPALERWIDQSQ